MGANYFEAYATGPTMQKAFEAAVEEARYEYGNRGYTGTIAEKHDARALSQKLMTTEEVREFIRANQENAIVQDKWGPAAAVKVQIGTGEIGWVFFGYASS